MALRLLLGFALALLVVGFGLAWLPLAFIAAGLALGAVAIVADFEHDEPKVSR